MAMIDRAGPSRALRHMLPHAAFALQYVLTSHLYVQEQLLDLTASPADAGRSYNDTAMSQRATRMQSMQWMCRGADQPAELACAAQAKAFERKADRFGMKHAIRQVVAQWRMPISALRAGQLGSRDTATVMQGPATPDISPQGRASAAVRRMRQAALP